MPDDSLLDLRFCDLRLQIRGTPLEDRIARLDDELSARGIRFRPHCWLSQEWFSPDGVPGIAMPFYLAHPRLIRLERKQMLEVEGGSEEWCMKILRHETGHAIDTAYRLRRRRIYRETFGRASQPYPEYYKPKPYSKQFVQHLEMWYAQSHPVEDFAETFAVWLKPRSRWRTQYRDWPALRKLECVDALIEDVADEPAPVRSREHIEPLRDLRTTLRDHYRQKRERYGIEHPHVYDQDLRRLFSETPGSRQRLPAAAFIRRIRPELRRTVAQWTGEYQYTIDQVLNEMISRCRDLRLYLQQPQPDAKRDTLILLTVQTMNHLHGGHHRLAL